MVEFAESLTAPTNGISIKKQLFYDFFLNKYNIHSYDLINEENLPFLKTLSPSKLLYDTFRKSFASVGGSLTLDILIDDILENIKCLHDQVMEEKKKLDKIKENTRILEALIKKMEEKPEKIEENITEEPIIILVSYVKDKKFDSEIFKVCRLKYKITTTESEKMKSIFSEKKQKVCKLEIFKNTEMIYVHILGKPILSFGTEDDFDIIATANLPLLILYSSIKPIYFEFDEIPPIYEAINYEYEVDENFAFEKKEIHCNFELKFEIKANLTQKKQIIKTLLDYYPEISEELENNMEKRIFLIRELLFPFEGSIVYEKNLENYLKKAQEHSSCSFEGCNLI